MNTKNSRDTLIQSVYDYKKELENKKKEREKILRRKTNGNDINIHNITQSPDKKED